MVQKTLEERRLAQRASEKKHRRKKQAAARMKLIACERDDFTIVDADARGTHLASDSIVEYRQSVIPGSGCGVFARVGLREGDVVTRFEGEIVSATPTDPEYAIEFKFGVQVCYIDGIRTPVIGKGLASFVNRESRTIPKARKNCVIVGVGGRMYVQVIRNIKPGSELYTVYSRGYRIK